MLLRGIRRNFFRLSPCCGQVPYVLLTRAPVAGSSASTTPLPLDLHVLSLSLAFILSQDQTLRCCLSIFLFFQNQNATNKSFICCCFRGEGIPHFPCGRDAQRTRLSRKRRIFRIVVFSLGGKLTENFCFHISLH